AGYRSPVLPPWAGLPVQDVAPRYRRSTGKRSLGHEFADIGVKVTEARLPPVSVPLFPLGRSAGRAGLPARAAVSRYRRGRRGRARSRARPGSPVSRTWTRRPASATARGQTGTGPAGSPAARRRSAGPPSG